jgi:hypothetical protein
MINMATMAADECREDASERTWRRWADKAGKVLGKYIADGSSEEGLLHDLYLDDCTPTEAVTEFLFQQGLVTAA